MLLWLYKTCSGTHIYVPRKPRCGQLKVQSSIRFQYTFCQIQWISPHGALAVRFVSALRKTPSSVNGKQSGSDQAPSSRTAPLIFWSVWPKTPQNHITQLWKVVQSTFSWGFTLKYHFNLPPKCKVWTIQRCFSYYIIAISCLMPCFMSKKRRLV